MEKEYEEKFMEDNIICPYCDYEECDSWDYSENDEEFQYPSCEKKFIMSIDVKTTYTCEANCTLNGDEHKFVLNERLTEELKKVSFCSVCGKIDVVRL